MRFASISSGSKGNVTYIGTERTHILVDVGVTMKAINERLGTMDLNLKDVSGIFITHEHSDHVRGVGVISRKYQIPIYGTLETLRELIAPRNQKYFGSIAPELLRPVLPDQETAVGDLRVFPFSIYHDVVNPVAYRVTDGKRIVAVATDLGHYDQYIAEHLRGLDALLLEANHDVRMLTEGPYPASLKRRILSDLGHLSNENSGRLLGQVLHDDLQHVFLGHLSEENNRPELALRTVLSEIDRADCPYHGTDFHITVARQGEMTEVVEI